MRGVFSVEVPTPRLRELRRQQTAAEKLAWHLLRDRRAGLKFRRQFPIGNYVVDFYCFEARLAVELDGSAHAQPSQEKRDRDKDAYLKSIGIRVLRLPNGLVTENPEEFVRKIRECGAPQAPVTRNDSVK
ncbi:MAG TPA: endonuclease domain-containing protein [Terriglobia bacterium]|nr:endonuclease domain-containing protein [Terriglobia bacterium]